jgi:hypothetical protein
VRELRNVIERAVILVNGNEDQRIHPCHLKLDQNITQVKTAGENSEPKSVSETAPEITPQQSAYDPRSVSEVILHHLELAGEETKVIDVNTGSRATPRHQTQTLQYEYGSIRAAPFYHDWVRDPKDLEPEISAMKLAGLAYEHTLEEILGSIKNPSKKSKEFRSKRWALYVAIYIMVKDLELDRKKIASFLSGISGGDDLAGIIDCALTSVDKKTRRDPAVARDVSEIRAHFRKVFMGLSS